MHIELNNDQGKCWYNECERSDAIAIKSRQKEQKKAVQQDQDRADEGERVKDMTGYTCRHNSYA